MITRKSLSILCIIFLVLGSSNYLFPESKNHSNKKHNRFEYEIYLEDIIDSLFCMNDSFHPKAKEKLNKYSEYLNNELNDLYNFKEYKFKTYLSWIDSTIKISNKTNNYAVVIDKYKYSLYIIYNGQVEEVYNIQLGLNPFVDKFYNNSGATPEGIYTISNKKDREETSFYRALLIDYPDVQDREEYHYLKQNNLLPNYTNNIGGLIEIHGSGSEYKGNSDKVYNWTAGCVALSNENIDKIFPYLEEGDVVTIVKYGSDYLLQPGKIDSLVDSNKLINKVRRILNGIFN